MSKKYYIFFLSIFVPFTVYTQDNTSIKDMFSFYQEFISDTRSGECPMYPSCSNYSMQAFSQYGAAKGFLLTTDRLSRCGHEHKLYDINWEKGSAKLEDFPSWNKTLPVLPKRYSVKYSRNLEFYQQLNDTTFFLSLINRKFYQEAILEYHRFAYFNPEARKSLILESNYLVALIGIGEYEKVIYHFENYLQPEHQDRPEILLEVSDAWFRLGNFESSLSVLEQINGSGSHADFKHLFSGINYTYLNRYNDARESFMKTSPDFIYKDFADYNAGIVDQLMSQKRKSPLLGGLLGIFPGGGYLYAGHNTTGITSLILTSLLGYATYTSFKTENYGVGILSGFFAFSFYTGSIAGGAKAAKRFNSQKEQSLKNKLKLNIQ
jgi:putative component of membrane protein insertase Oxa1/YidC/SpoIIIJ protein YidD